MKFPRLIRMFAYHIRDTGLMPLRRGRKTTAVGVINHGQRSKFSRATEYILTGNEIYNDGQRNLRQRATKFKAAAKAENKNVSWPFQYGKHMKRFSDFLSTFAPQKRTSI